LKISVTISACVFLVGVCGCKPEAPVKRVEGPLAVKTVRPHKAEILRSVTLPGTVVANQQATLFAKATGYLKKINVDKGDAVKAGDVLAEIEAPELIADLGKAKAELELAQVEYSRSSEAQKKAPDLVVAETVDIAKGKLDVAKANVQRAETLVGFCKITAPFSSVVTRRFVDAGAFIPAAGASSTAQSAALVSLADFKVVRVQVSVPEPEVSFVKQGVPATVSVEALPGRSFQGGVTRFAQALDDATKTMLAEIDLENPNGELRPGMYATVKLGVEKHVDASLLPADAVLIEKSGASVFTVADNKAVKAPVKLGFSDGTSVEILDGVKPDAAVIVVGKATLNNGQAVTVGPEDRK
jgi:membrane fusion protein (multidrug efflux system)